MRKRFRSFPLLVTVAVAITGMKASAASLSDTGAHIIIVPNELSWISVDESKVSNEYSTDKYRVLIYKTGEDVTMTASGENRADVVKASDFSDFNGDKESPDGTITFTMPAEDLYVQTADANTDSDIEKPDTYTTQNGTGYIGDVPENVTVDVIMTDGSEAVITNGGYLSLKNPVSSIHASAEDGMKLTYRVYKDSVRTTDKEALFSELTEDKDNGVTMELNENSKDGGWAILFSDETTGTAVVNTKSLNLRSEDSSDSDRITILSEGDEVSILDKNGDGSWTKVKTSDGETGWVRSVYIKNKQEEKK